MNAQGTQAWLDERAGHCTASRAADVLATIRTGEAASRRNYRVQLVTERLTGIPHEGYFNAAMQWGQDMEPNARSAYEIETGEVVQQTGFLKSGVQWVGASPDGLVGSDGGLEIKCPHQSTVHVETLQGGMPSEHVAQIQFQLWVTGRLWIDFASYDPRMPEKLRLYIQRVKRDDDYIRLLSGKVADFLAEVEKLHQQILRMA